MQTFDEKEISVVANAIGWIFFGENSEDGKMVQVSEEDAQKCQDAAKRALESIEKYRTLSGDEEASASPYASYE